MINTRWSALVGLALLVGQPAIAQEATFRTRSEFKAGGTLGTLMSMAGGLQGEESQTRTEYVTTTRMRTDEPDGSSTIIDLEAQRMYLLQHEQETYVSIPMDSVAEAVTALAGAVSEEERERGEAGAQAPTLEFSVDVERTGERESISGFPAERLLLTMEAEGTEGASMDPEEDTPTRVVLLMDVWLSQDVPGYETLQGFQQRLVGGLQETGRAAGGALLDALTQVPGTQEALAKAAEERGKLQGMPVRSSTYVVSVPLGQPFERDAVLNPEDRGAGSAVKGAARSALGGLFGRRKQTDVEDERPEEPTQSTILTLVETLLEADTGSLDPSLFQVPANYTEVQAELSDVGQAVRHYVNPNNTDQRTYVFRHEGLTFKITTMYDDEAGSREFARRAVAMVRR